MISQVQGYPFRFSVPSRSNAGTFHVVDLSNHGFNGDCDCHRFLFVCLPRLRRRPVPEDKVRCRHIEQARNAFFQVHGPRLIGVLR